jgi:hypothetical protein
VTITGIIAASDDDWDRYESLHWRALEEWLAEHPDDEFGHDTSTVAATTSGTSARCSTGRSSSAVSPSRF